MVVESLSHRVAPTSNLGRTQLAASSTSGASSESMSTPLQSQPSSTPTLSTMLLPARYKKRSAQAVHREQLREKRKALDAKIIAAKTKFVDDIAALGKEYHKSAQELKSRALVKNKFGITKRRINSYNAFRRMQSKQRKEAKESQGFDAAQQDHISYRDADPELIETAWQEMEAEKEAKRGHIHKNPRARAQHSDKVIRAFDVAVKELNFSCEIEAICLYVNGSNRDHPVLQAVYTSKGLEFLEGPMKLNINNLLLDFQTFAQTGSKGMAKSHKILQSELRAQVSALLLRNLQETAHPDERIGKMKYADFEERICQRYGVKLVGWPEEIGEFRNPSLIGNQHLLKLVAQLKSGACHFEKVPLEDTE